MSKRIVSAGIAILLLCGVAAAESYCIRTERRINLRTGASLQHRVVETAPVGMSLHVTGAHGRWLKISRSGDDAWMANWVSYSRVDNCDGSQPASSAGSQPGGDINNCCFVDRQCHSEQDWTDGYWAFQNKQCQAPSRPAQSQQPAAAQPASSAPAQADNCCSLGWQCHNDDDWQKGYFAFQENSCEHPWLKIHGDGAFLGRVKTALAILQNGAPTWYDYAAQSGLHLITQIGYHDRRGGFHPGEMAFYTSGYHAGDELWFASAIVHEACHAYQWVTGTMVEGWRNEAPCLDVQIAMYDVIDPSNYSRRNLVNLRENIENPEYWWWD